MKGKYKKQDIIVMPAFTLLKGGMDIIHEESRSPYVPHKQDFEIFVVGDKIYNFGKVKDIKN